MLYETNGVTDVEQDEHKTTTRMPKQLHKAARIKAIECDISLSEAIRRFLVAWVTGETELPAKENEPEEE